MSADRRVTIVSHGPNCLDGLTCAVVASRRFSGRRFEPVFASNREIDRILQHYDPTTPDREELWITDISWREPATDVHLERLVANGLRLYWIDHHKTAIDRRAEGHLQGPFTDFVLDDAYAASRLTYNYLASTHDDAWPERGDDFADLERLVMMADDVDRWILKIPGSRELGLAVRAMDQGDAYRTLLSARGDVMQAPEIRQALLRVETELGNSMALARATRRVSTVSGSRIEIVAAECDDYAGEIADRWKPEFACAVFVLYDRRSDAISLRRSPKCDVDLSRLAAAFGGGHAAAAGCQIRSSGSDRSTEIARKVAEALAREQSS